jgi:hypothetical protein
LLPIFVPAARPPTGPTTATGPDTTPSARARPPDTRPTQIGCPHPPPDRADIPPNLNRELQRLHDPTGAELLDQLDALLPETPEIIQISERPDVARIRARLDQLQQRGIDPPALSL